MYRKILLAYDGSLEGGIALREGAILAKQDGAEVCILSVLPLQVAEGHMGGAVAHQMEHYRAVLERGVARLTALGMKPTARMAVGEPAQVIGAFAREMGVDLVVVGHQKRRLLERWWSGPAGAYICDFIDCSLLIARTAISDEVFEAKMKEAQKSG